MQATGDNDARTSPPWKYSSVLLIDSNPSRQFERAASMRRCGLRVDCAGDATAASALWEQDKYRLVLIELHGAAEDVRAFSSRLQTLSPSQRVGIYRSKPPFIVQAGDPVLMSPDTARLPGEGMKEAAGEAARKGGYSLVHAAQRIRAMRPRPARPPAAPPISDRSNPESPANIAARVLGGAE